MLIAPAGLFGIFLFLTYYLQQTLGYSPLVTGVAFLPLSAGLILASNLSTTVLMPRFGPRPLVASGMLAAAGAMVWLAQLGPHTAYAAGVLGPTILAGTGVGMVIAPVINTGTFGVAPQDAGVASAAVTVGQNLGASVGTSLLNTIFAAAVTSYLAAHLAAARLIGRPARAWPAYARARHRAHTRLGDRGRNPTPAHRPAVRTPRRPRSHGRMLLDQPRLCFFSVITRQAIRRGSFTSVRQLSTPSAPSSTPGTTTPGPSPGPKTPTRSLASIGRAQTKTSGLTKH